MKNFCGESHFLSILFKRSIRVKYFALVILTLNFAPDHLAQKNDTLFISAEDLLNANFNIAYPSQENQEEILWQFSPGDDSL